MASNQPATSRDLTAELERVNNTIDEIMSEKAKLAESKVKVNTRAQEAMANLADIERQIEEGEAEVAKTGKGTVERQQVEANLEELDKAFLKTTAEVKV